MLSKLKKVLLLDSLRPHSRTDKTLFKKRSTVFIRIIEVVSDLNLPLRFQELEVEITALGERCKRYVKHIYDKYGINFCSYSFP